MSEFHLVIGNKNYSSWSLRPWMLMTHLGVKFRETILPLDTAQFKDEIARYCPTGRVPVLLHGELAIWDSLAICEYIAEVTGQGWPVDRTARAVARSVCAEMHSGFANLRAEWPLNARARNRRTPTSPGLDADIDNGNFAVIDRRHLEARSLQQLRDRGAALVLHRPGRGSVAHRQHGRLGRVHHLPPPWPVRVGLGGIAFLHCFRHDRGAIRCGIGRVTGTRICTCHALSCSTTASPW